MAWLGMSEAARVKPSGGLFARLAMPSVPPAPGLFSTTNCWPLVSVSPCASARARMSLTPAGGHGTIILTGLAGYGCAVAAVATAMSSMARALRNGMGPPCFPFKSEQGGAEHCARHVEPGIDRRGLEWHQQQHTRDDECHPHAHRHHAQ